MSCSENCQCWPDVVALVFVPGIMGTRIKNRSTGKAVWDPVAGRCGHETGISIDNRRQRDEEMAADATAILGFCQGRLELLSNQHYRIVDNEREWLLLKTGENDSAVVDIGYGASVFDFYKRFDPWYGMVQSELGKSTDEALEDYVYAMSARLTEVEGFHERLSDDFHTTTTLLGQIN